MLSVFDLHLDRMPQRTVRSRLGPRTESIRFLAMSQRGRACSLRPANITGMAKNRASRGAKPSSATFLNLGDHVYVQEENVLKLRQGACGTREVKESWLTGVSGFRESLCHQSRLARRHRDFRMFVQKVHRLQPNEMLLTFLCDPIGG